MERQCNRCSITTKGYGGPIVSKGIELSQCELKLDVYLTATNMLEKCDERRERANKVVGWQASYIYT